MKEIVIIPRELTSEEYATIKTGFDNNTLNHKVDIQSSERYSFVALDKGIFIGCSSGLAYRNGATFCNWFYLTDLFVVQKYRHKGLGTKLLSLLEQHISQLGIGHFWTWTAGFEAPEFYRNQGYELFAEMENWYSDGSSRYGLKKKL